MGVANRKNMRGADGRRGSSRSSLDRAALESRLLQANARVAQWASAKDGDAVPFESPDEVRRLVSGGLLKDEIEYWLDSFASETRAIEDAAQNPESLSSPELETVVHYAERILNVFEDRLVTIGRKLGGSVDQ